MLSNAYSIMSSFRDAILDISVLTRVDFPNPDIPINAIL